MHPQLAFANSSNVSFNRIRRSQTCIRPTTTTRVAVRRWRATAADPERPKNIQPPTPDPLPEPPAQQESQPDAQPVPDAQFEQQVPGKIQLDELTIAKQRTVLEEYSRELRQKRLEEEREAARIFGWVPYAETLNGRLAMFFLVTGLLTEYWTGYTLPEQVELMLRTLGII
ncbi:Light-harvesting complex-like protein OHP2, chloroplastic [Gracilariopsis chorda]|uniref:Light-harvesting complex-like protein OHP2, chloroplastic n=1 Tax=Gracilariopsis chorda TaxID=448386 RepID=A0A2V3IG60_9FLOR|nr:Light-harvesting complex-like protein OHP2, chloroplastic [Gracilariopsis chorda]|eukprot:PXF41032.1 Light-harvesting complex-like protein OHP2, chloroplastic [Gracilariopsis chorda]